MGKKRQTRQADQFADLRSLLGTVKSRGFKVDDRRRAYRYRIGLQAVLMNARTNGSDAAPSEFFRTLDSLVKLDAARFSRQPIAHDFLLQLLKAKSQPIDRELRWIAARIGYEADTINVHVAKIQAIHRHFVAEDYGQCLRELQDQEDQLGYSLWSTELKIGLTQENEGVEKQKELLKSIRAIRRKGVWPYIANLASVRAEPTVSISWFLEEHRQRLSRLKPSQFNEYLKYRAFGRWPETNAACARILQVEQNHHVVDIYETFISYLQEASTRKTSPELRLIVEECLSHLHHIHDARLRKLEFAYFGKYSALPRRDLSFIALMLSSDQQGVLAEARRELKLPMSPEGILGLALMAGRPWLSQSNSSLKNAAIRGLSQALQRGGRQTGNSVRADEKLKKLGSVFNPLPFARLISALLDATTSKYTDDAVKRLQLAALNDDSWGAIDLVGFARSPFYEGLRSRFSRGAMTALSDSLASRQAEESEQTLREDVSSLFMAAGKLLSSRSADAAEEVLLAIDSDRRIISSQAAVVALNAYIRTGDVAKASDLIVSEHVDHQVDSELLPVREVYDGLDWSDLRESASTPQLSVALSLIQASEGDDKLRTYRRFALETLLLAFGKRKPSELRSVDTGWSTQYLSYFLGNVCTAAMLDMLPSIRSSREVLEERREICGYLASVDKDDAERHRQEVLAISRELTVLDGLRTIDGSRVHVDVEAIARRLKVDLAEGFQRYGSLKRAKEVTYESLALLIKDIGRHQKSDQILAMPVSESDELLVSMIVRARDRFLFDVPNGLDSYISKRIRHGSIIGVVRAPAEREGVIARRNLDGSYRVNGMWSDVIQEPQQRAALAAAIKAASKAIDQHLVTLKDTLLHVKSDAKPHGIFEAPLSPPSYIVIRSFADADLTIDGFIDTMFQSFWAMLGPSLSHAQSLLRKDSIAFVSEQFQSLRTKAQRILKDTEDKASFDAAAARASVGMQAALQIAASWFEPVESEPRSYSLDGVIDIAMESVRATVEGFSPTLEISSNSEFSFSELALPLVCDVLYIALGNVAAHAGVGESPKIWLTVNREDADERLTFVVENEVIFSNEEERRYLLEKLGAIRSELTGSAGVSKARIEGGSGLHKLAAIVSQVPGDELDFDCDNERFRLSVKLKFSPDRPF